MSIYKVNDALSATTKISTINDMLLELNGQTAQGEFDVNELDQLYDILGFDRKYVRNATLGHTLSTYSTWTHVQAEDGYSIWKITPSNYRYNSVNELYFDDVLLTNKGQANSESATAFDYTYVYNGDSGSGYTDNTTEAGTELGTQFILLDSTNDYLYIGLSSTFSGIKFEFHTRGSNHTLKVEYFDETSGVNAFAQLTANSNGLSDNTSNFESDGIITWTTPSDWGLTTINGQEKYWVRISTTTTPVTAAYAYLVVPANSVVGLLGLSSSEITNESWKWCSFGSSVYVTIRNTGHSAYEGNYYIASSSNNTNLQNFFVYNHTYSLNHEDSSYVSDLIFEAPDSAPADVNLVNGSIAFWIDEGSNNLLMVKVKYSDGTVKSGNVSLT